jgi:hypothetical protein
MVVPTLMRWTIGLTVALGATLTYALALIYFAPGAMHQYGRIAGFVCLEAMFAGVVLVRGKVIFRQLVPVAAIASIVLMIQFAALAWMAGLAAVPAPTFLALALLPVVLFGGVVFVRMLIRVW